MLRTVAWGRGPECSRGTGHSPLHVDWSSGRGEARRGRPQVLGRWAREETSRLQEEGRRQGSPHFSSHNPTVLVQAAP